MDTLAAIKNNKLDFNDALPQSQAMAKSKTRVSEKRVTADELKQQLHDRLLEALYYLFPEGKVEHKKFFIGNLQGFAGKSLNVELSGDTIGLWHDFETGEGGDILSLWGAAHGWDNRRHFLEISTSVQEWLGIPQYSIPQSNVATEARVPETPVPEVLEAETQALLIQPPVSQPEGLGTPVPTTEKARKGKGEQDDYMPIIPVPEDAPAFTEEMAWFYNQKFGCAPCAISPYRTKEGGLVGYIVRWDILKPDGTKAKQTRPFVFAGNKSGQKNWRARGFPAPLPLYNLHEIASRPESTVLVCEGEKTAEAAKILFPSYVASTSAHGANSANKTDWSPLKGKNVMISPDFDKAGQGYAEEVASLCRKAGVKSIRYCFPETFHILEKGYFEEKAHYRGNMMPRIEVAACFSIDMPASNPPVNQMEEGTAVMDEGEETGKQALALPERLRLLKENASEDTLEIFHDAKILNESYLNLFPYDATRKAFEGYDLADAKEEGWTANSVQSVIDEIGEDKFFPAILCSSLKGVNTEGGMFNLKPSGVYSGSGKKICGYLKPVASCRDKNGNEWALLVEFIDKDFNRREMLIPMKVLPKDGSAISEILLNAGLWVNIDPKEGRQGLKFYLNQTPRERMVLVNKIGWHDQNYVLPDKTWGKEQQEKIRFHREGRLPVYQENCSLGEWKQHIGQYAEGNSRLQIGILMALGSTVLSPLQRENFGIHLVGKSSSGKSTALKVACSVFGSEFRTWRTTDNSAESWGVSSNDNLLCLDEIGKAPTPAVVSDMLYLLGDGQGKGRADKHGDAREVNRFKICFLSSGEIGVETKLNEGVGKKAYYAGQSVRLVEIPADAGVGEKMGIYENLHSFQGGANGAKLSDHLAAASTQYCGALGDAWLTHLTGHYDEALSLITHYQKKWLEEHCLDQEADGQVKRVVGHFSFYAAVGELAIAQNLLPWATGSASEACAKIFNAWLKQRGGIDSHENMQVIKKLLTFIEEHGSSRFENPWDANNGNTSDVVKDEKVFHRAGFRKLIEGKYVYYFLPKSFELNILDGTKGEAQRSLLKVLAENGYLATCMEKKANGNTVTVHSILTHIPTYGTKRVYAVKLEAI